MAPTEASRHRCGVKQLRSKDGETMYLYMASKCSQPSSRERREQAYTDIPTDEPSKDRGEITGETRM
jgi:hypothetical protein